MAADVVRLSGCVGLSGAAALCVAVGLSGCHRLAPPTPLDQLNAQQMHGHAVFQVRCGQCHYDREEGPLHGPSLRGIYKKPYLQSGAPANDERVRATVLHGHGLMPAQPNMDLQDLDDLMAYLRTL
jgi:mono/diheme cytochrome c family protein